VIRSFTYQALPMRVTFGIGALRRLPDGGEPTTQRPGDEHEIVERHRIHPDLAAAVEQVEDPHRAGPPRRLTAFEPPAAARHRQLVRAVDVRQPHPGLVEITGVDLRTLGNRHDPSPRGGASSRTAPRRARTGRYRAT
jgi:hypothetical protein